MLWRTMCVNAIWLASSFHCSIGRNFGVWSSYALLLSKINTTNFGTASKKIVCIWIFPQQIQWNKFRWVDRFKTSFDLWVSINNKKSCKSTMNSKNIFKGWNTVNSVNLTLNGRHWIEVGLMNPIYRSFFSRFIYSGD